MVRGEKGSSRLLTKVVVAGGGFGVAGGVLGDFLRDAFWRGIFLWHDRHDGDIDLAYVLRVRGI